MTTKEAKDPNMGDKVGGLFGSIRFWSVTLGAVVGVASAVGAISEDVAKVVIVWIGTVVGLGTADKIAETMASRKPPVH